MTMPRRFLWLVVFGALLGVHLPLFAATARYDIERYIATLELHEGSADADVALDITYDIFDGEKSDGFKYVGTYEPVNLRGVDDEGRPMAVSLRRYRENQVYWSFPPVHSGRKSVMIQFTLRDVLRGTKESNVLSAPWIGVFKVPVREAEYHVVFPSRMTPTIQSMTPAHAQSTVLDGKAALVVAQSPLTQPALSIRFAPGLVANSSKTASEVMNSASNAWNDWWPFLALFGIGGLLIWGIVNSAKYRSGSGSGAGWWGGGCGGGGCGGGGCGGGGCGGGCGG